MTVEQINKVIEEFAAYKNRQHIKYNEIDLFKITLFMKSGFKLGFEQKKGKESIFMFDEALELLYDDLNGGFVSTQEISSVLFDFEATVEPEEAPEIKDYPEPLDRKSL